MTSLPIEKLFEIAGNLCVKMQENVTDDAMVVYGRGALVVIPELIVALRNAEAKTKTLAALVKTLQTKADPERHLEAAQQFETAMSNLDEYKLTRNDS